MSKEPWFFVNIEIRAVKSIQVRSAKRAIADTDMVHHLFLPFLISGCEVEPIYIGGVHPELREELHDP
jgi:hypothetical protein